MNEIMRTPSPVDILLVEDNPGDIELTQEAFHMAKVANRIHIAHDGNEALDFLSQKGRFATAVRPDLIVLDLNLPGKDGKEVLADIKQDEALKYIPVIILTSSEAEKDILRSYELHANAYIVKPVDFPKLIEVVHAVEHFWFAIVNLPPRHPKKKV